MAAFVLGRHHFQVRTQLLVHGDNHGYHGEELQLVAESDPGDGASYRITITKAGTTGHGAVVGVAVFHHGLAGVASAYESLRLLVPGTIPGIINAIVHCLYKNESKLALKGMYLTQDPPAIVPACVVTAASEPRAGSFLFNDIRRFPDGKTLPGTVSICGLPFSTTLMYNDSRSSLHLQCKAEDHDLEVIVDVDETPSQSLTAFCTRRDGARGTLHCSIDLDIPEKRALMFSVAQLRAHAVTELNRAKEDLQRRHMIPADTASAATEPEAVSDTDKFITDLIAYVESGAGAGRTVNTHTTQPGVARCMVTAMPLALNAGRLVELLFKIDVVADFAKFPATYHFSIQTKNPGEPWVFELRRITGKQHKIVVLGRGDATRVLAKASRGAGSRSPGLALEALARVVGDLVVRLRSRDQATAAAEPQVPAADKVVQDLKRLELRAGDEPIGSKVVAGLKYMFTGAGADYHDDPEVHAYVSLPAPPEHEQTFGTNLFDLAKVVVSVRLGKLSVTATPVPEHTPSDQHRLRPFTIDAPASPAAVISKIIDVVAREVKPRKKAYV